MSDAKDIKDLKPKPPVNLETMRPKDQIAHLLHVKRNEIAKMLPKHLNAERLLKVATIAATTTPALAKCDVPSLVSAIGQCAQMGLEPNTILGHCYLVPFNVKRKVNGVDTWVMSVQVIIGYRGLIELARRSGQIISIAAHEVCEKDDFVYEYGLHEKLKHVPARGARGEPISFYAVARLKDGGHCFEVMSREQVEEIREGSQGYQQAVKFKKEASHPWKKHFTEMGRKTAIRRLAKYLPMSIEFAHALDIDGKVVDAPALDDPNTVEGEMQWLDGDTGEITNGEPLDDMPPFDREPGALDEQPPPPKATPDQPPKVP